jgi:hypothetical protein
VWNRHTLEKCEETDRYRNSVGVSKRVIQRRSLEILACGEIHSI